MVDYIVLTFLVAQGLVVETAPKWDPVQMLLARLRDFTRKSAPFDSSR